MHSGVFIFLTRQITIKLVNFTILKLSFQQCLQIFTTWVMSKVEKTAKKASISDNTLPGKKALNHQLWNYQIYIHEGLWGKLKLPSLIWRSCRENLSVYMVKQGCSQHLPMLVSNFQYSHQISTKTTVVKCYYLNYVKCKTMQTLLVSGPLPPTPPPDNRHADGSSGLRGVGGGGCSYSSVVEVNSFSRGAL